MLSSVQRTSCIAKKNPTFIETTSALCTIDSPNTHRRVSTRRGNGLARVAGIFDRIHGTTREPGTIPSACISSRFWASCSLKIYFPVLRSSIPALLKPRVYVRKSARNISEKGVEEIRDTRRVLSHPLFLATSAFLSRRLSSRRLAARTYRVRHVQATVSAPWS